VSRRLQQLVDEAKSAGFTITKDPDGTIKIVKRHGGHGRPIRGLVIFPNGTAFDATVDLSVARGIRSYKAMRSVLGLGRRAYQKPVSEMSGYKTLVTPSGEKGLPSRTDKKKKDNWKDRPGVPSNDSYREQARPLPPKHEKNRERHQPTPDEPSRRPEYNTPPPSGTGQTPDGKSLNKDRARTKSTPGEEYGHPYLDQGPAGMKGRRPLQGRQMEQGGEAKQRSREDYKANRDKVKRRSLRRYEREGDIGEEKLRRRKYRRNPGKYERMPGGYRDPAERTKDWREEHPSSEREAGYGGDDFFLEKGNPDQDSETYYDRGQGAKKWQDGQDDRHTPAPGQKPWYFVNDDPGSAKVIPEGHGFVNKSERVPKRAATIGDIESRCDEVLHERSQGIGAKLKRVDARNAMWTFAVEGSKGPYTVRVKAPRKGNVRDVGRLDVYVSCSCPFWRWQGPEHWAKSSGYLYGKPVGTASKPDIKDPTGTHGACKHVLAVLAKIKDMGMVKPQWGRAKRGSDLAGLQYLADRIARGEMRVLSVERVATRYLRRVIHRAQRSM